MPKNALQHPEKTPQFAEDNSLIDELIATVATGGVKQRLRILQEITDLFVAGAQLFHRTNRAVRRRAAGRHPADIEVKARAKLAQRLADVSGAPPRLIRLLAFDDAIEVAGPVLAHSEQLSDDDLVENARTRSSSAPFRHR